MLDQHPMAWLDPLWMHFHGLRRPPSATPEDAVAVLREIGVDAGGDPLGARATHRGRTRSWVARRLCLPPDRVPEVDAALDDLVRPRIAATLAWSA